MKFHLRLWPLACLLVVFAACSDIEETYEVLPVTLSPSEESNKIVWEWTDLYLAIEKDLPGFRPAPTCRALGYIHMGAYETVVPAMDRYRSLSNVIEGFQPPVLKYDLTKINWPIALNAYYARTHQFFFFNANAAQIARIHNLESEQLDLLRHNVADGIVETSIEWGQDVANAIMAYAETDQEGSSQSRLAIPGDYFPPTGDGLWQPTLPDLTHAMFPYWGRVRTFAAKHNDLTSPPPVHQYSTDPESGYYKEHLEVSNAVTNMTEENHWIAEFWSDDITGLTFSPPARIFAIGNQVIFKEEYSLEETLHLYCKLGIATNDAAVAAWKSKYTYNIQRPEPYIRENINPDFKPILGAAIGRPGITPAFPGYPSGHSTFAGVGLRIFEHFFGENYEITDLCHYGRNEFRGYPRTFTSWRQMMEENAYSRIPLGVHIRMDCSEGLRLGNVVGVRALSLDLAK